MNFLNKYPALSGLANKQADAITEEMIAKANAELTAEKITAVKVVSSAQVEAFQANASKVTDLQTKLDAATADATNKADKITALEQEVAQLKADNKSAGDTHTPLHSKKSTESDGTGAAQEAYNASTFDFNQRANKALGIS